MGAEPALGGRERPLNHLMGGEYHTEPALTLKLWALVTLALSPGSANATAAIFLLGEARQRVTATLEEGMWRGIITECPAPTCLSPEASFLLQAPTCDTPLCAVMV